MVQKYDRVRHISSGRFGSTILVKVQNGRLAAMKTIDMGRLTSRERVELIHEILQLAKLRHPNLVAVQECFELHGKLCLISEYIEGGTLAGEIEKARGREQAIFSRDQVLQWFSEALLGLSYLHGRDVVHRDIRTRRLLLSRQGHVLLSGTALAPLLKTALATERPDLQAIIYLSPELLSGTEEHSCASDMWALGIVLYELLMLRPPFEHEHPRVLLDSIRSGPLRPLPSKCPADVVSLCYALLRRSTADRLSVNAALNHEAVQQRLVHLLEHIDELPGKESFAAVPPWHSNREACSPGNLRTRPFVGLGPLSLASHGGTPRALRRAGEENVRMVMGSARLGSHDARLVMAGTS